MVVVLAFRIVALQRNITLQLDDSSFIDASLNPRGTREHAQLQGLLC